MQHVYKSIKEFNPEKRRKPLIAFDDMIFGMIRHRTIHQR